MAASNPTSFVSTAAVSQAAGIPANTPQQAWFSVPEGEAGQIVNALSTMGHSLDPRNLISLSGLRSIVDDTIESIQQTVGLSTGQQTSWTVIHATTQAQVYALEQAGLKAYATKADAQAQSNAQNRNVNASGTGPLTGVNAIGDLAQRLTQPHTWVRVGEFTAGAILIAIGLNHFLGNPAGTAAKVAKSVPKFPI